MTEPLALLLEAAGFAAARHHGQRRKGAGAEPSINHCLEVARILATEGGVTDPVTLAAALLHDTIEDTETTREEIAQRFGSTIAALVEQVTDPPELPRNERRRLQIERAPRLDGRAKLVRLADKIANVRALVTDPPSGWSRNRRLAYLRWAQQVVQRLQADAPALERAFEQACATAFERLRERTPRTPG